MKEEWGGEWPESLFDDFDVGMAFHSYHFFFKNNLYLPFLFVLSFFFFKFLERNGAIIKQSIIYRRQEQVVGARLARWHCRASSERNDDYGGR